jgi:signal transduction histidine kinase
MSHTSSKARSKARKIGKEDPIRFAGSELRENLHVCAFFSTPEEEYRVLLPFIEEGLERGEKALHVVEPGLLKAHLRRLKSAGIDLSSVEKNRQFEVFDWNEMYFPDGRFDESRMMAKWEATLNSAVQDGYPRTRVIAHLEWLNKDVKILLRYEAKFNLRPHRDRDPVICIYDLARHSGAFIIDVLRTHPMILIGGLLQENPFYVPPELFLQRLDERGGQSDAFSNVTMRPEPKTNFDELERLRGFVNDLVSVQELAGLWFRHESSQSVSTLLDAIIQVLRLDLAYARVSDSIEGPPIEVLRLPPPQDCDAESAKIRRAVQGWLGEDPLTCPLVVPHPCGEGKISIAPFRLGLLGEIGVLVAGSQRPDFPTKNETLLLHMATNQVVIGLQELQLLSAQQRIAIEDRRRAEEELRHLSGQLLRSQDDERRRIARDLHDSTGQNLVALATMLSQVRGAIPSGNRKQRGLLSECKALAERCVREVRTLSYVLHPPVLEQAGLGDAIRDYVDGFAKRSGIHVELELSPRLGRMAGDVEIALFRVVQEALTNIQRHSGSQLAKIRIERDSSLTLEISDRGHGTSVARQREEEQPRFVLGVGIPSMQERVKLIGGSLHIDSSSRGTTVRVTIPLEKEQSKSVAS